MPINSIYPLILDVFEELDKAIPPFGLYSMGDLPRLPSPYPGLEEFLLLPQRKPQYAPISPLIESLTHLAATGRFMAYPMRLSTSFGGKSYLHLKRTSKIKVRKYGSNYQVDKQKNYETRWKELALENELGLLRRNSWPDNELNRQLLFIGFDKSQRPFEREIAELALHQNRVAQGIEYLERAWDDRYGRGFRVKLTFWGCQRE